MFPKLLKSAPAFAEMGRQKEIGLASSMAKKYWAKNKERSFFELKKTEIYRSGNLRLDSVRFTAVVDARFTW